MPPLLFVFLTVPTHKKEASQWLFSLKYRLFWRVFFVVVSEYQFGFFCLFWRWNDTKLCFFFLLWACWNKFQHGRRPLGWFFKHAIASLWRLGDAVKLAKLGTRTQKIGPSQQETTFLNTLWVLHTFVFVCLFLVFYKNVRTQKNRPKSARDCLLNILWVLHSSVWVSLETWSSCQTRQYWHKITRNRPKPARDQQEILFVF